MACDTDVIAIWSLSTVSHKLPVCMVCADSLSTPSYIALNTHSRKKSMTFGSMPPGSHDRPSPKASHQQYLLIQKECHLLHIYSQILQTRCANLQIHRVSVLGYSHGSIDHVYAAFDQGLLIRCRAVG
jgi:hypothetical protein